jgi:hypothetical protein
MFWAIETSTMAHTENLTTEKEKKKKKKEYGCETKHE